MSRPRDDEALTVAVDREEGRAADQDVEPDPPVERWEAV